MLVPGAYEALPPSGQILHGLHFMLCAFAVLVACGPLLAEKGTPEHKFFGFIYLPLSLAALLLASFMAWREQSMVLFCFNCFCAYLLMSGWRAVHEGDRPNVIDWLIPCGLLSLAIGVTLQAVIRDQGMRSFYLLFFAANALYLSWRDWKHLRRRAQASKYKIFFADTEFGISPAHDWMGRHIAGMVGSMIANLSVVVLTLLPLELHWLWPVSLLVAGAWIAWNERRKKQRVRKLLATALNPKFRPAPPSRDDEDIRKAA